LNSVLVIVSVQSWWCRWVEWCHWSTYRYIRH